jgi:hypothetical protein
VSIFHANDPNALAYVDFGEARRLSDTMYAVEVEQKYIRTFYYQRSSRPSEEFEPFNITIQQYEREGVYEYKTGYDIRRTWEGASGLNGGQEVETRNPWEDFEAFRGFHELLEPRPTSSPQLFRFAV